MEKKKHLVKCQSSERLNKKEDPLCNLTSKPHSKTRNSNHPILSSDGHIYLEGQGPKLPTNLKVSRYCIELEGHIYYLRN